MSFNNKVVLVTGGSSGIGAAIGIKFAAEGAKVAIIGRNQNKLKNVATKCGKPLVITADITKDEDCKRIVSETISHFGKLDILVNNAGIADMTEITAKNAMEVFDKVMATNLRSVVYITHLASPYLIESKGNIVNISSIAAMRVLMKGGFSYQSSKAGLDHFTRSIALDLASSGIRANSINPGPVKTDIAQNDAASVAIQEATWEGAKQLTILNRISEPEEVAELVMYLASDKAVSITGASFTIDNGMLLRNPVP